jgi:hypothetical protein
MLFHGSVPADGFVSTREAVAPQRRPPEGGLTEVVCAFCRKSASEAEVREGEKLFHLDCYLLYRRQKPR